MIATADWSTLVNLLRRPYGDAMVMEFLGSHIGELDRNHDFNYVEIREAGLEVVFGPAARVVPAGELTDLREPRLIAFHFHRAGHEGYSPYIGAMPGGAALDDPEWTILRKLGAPASSGGGGTSSRGAWTPYWIKYQIGTDSLRFQSDRKGGVEMATLIAPDARMASAPPQHRMMIISIPSRVSLLWSREQGKGSPLTEREVAETCNESASVALPLAVAAAVEDGRGYRDIDPGNCWAEWQQTRIELIEHENKS